MANTGKDASGEDIWLWLPFNESGIDNANAYGFGSVIGFNRNGIKQVPTLDLAAATNNRPIPTILLSGDGAAPYSPSLPFPVTLPTAQILALTPPTTVTANLGTIAGAATAANQTAANTSLASIDSKTPSLGQALSGASIPVVLPSAQVLALTPPTTVTANLGTIAGAATASNQTTANTSLASIDSKFPSLGQALAAASIPVVLPSAQVLALTPPTTVTANLGTIAGVATTAKQDTGNASLASIDGKIGAGVTLTSGNGSTHSLANTWTQVFAAKSDRKKLFIQNRPENAANIEVGHGAPGSEAVLSVLQPGDSLSDSSLSVVVERISIRCPTATSVAFIAKEA